MAHGGGGRLMHQLIRSMFFTAFSDLAENTPEVHDAAVLPFACSRVAFSTDSYVVKPLFFPGGDIGALAVNGTVNDLAMVGARPRFLSLGFIIEEGLPMETLWRVVQSIRRAAIQAGVKIATGDTKVVDRGMGDGMFINSSGIGELIVERPIGASAIEPGDRILVNGDLGRHGIAVMAVREGLEFESAIESDTAPLNGVVAALLEQGIEVHCMRDLTRGGLASAANELAEASGLGMALDESMIPVREDVRGACEILGLDPLYVANEGRFMAFVPAAQAEAALAILRSCLGGEQAATIGTVRSDAPAMVRLNSTIGAARILDMISGEQLPRIC